jgi:iron complex outermembrane receptor protein
VNADKARSVGTEVELLASPTDNLDFALSASLTDSELLTTFRTLTGSVVAGIEEGNRLPSVPQIQMSAAATYKWDVGTSSQAFITGSYQHVGSRFTLIDDHGTGICPPGAPNCPLGVVDLKSFERPPASGETIGGPLTDTLFTFDPELPAYSLVNLRAGITRESWELTVFLNNVFDERALLALDRERGTRARVGYLTNPPRTGGVTLRFNY